MLWIFRTTNSETSEESSSTAANVTKCFEAVIGYTEKLSWPNEPTGGSKCHDVKGDGNVRIVMLGGLLIMLGKALPTPSMPVWDISSCYLERRMSIHARNHRRQFRAQPRAAQCSRTSLHLGDRLARLHGERPPVRYGDRDQRRMGTGFCNGTLMSSGFFCSS